MHQTQYDDGYEIFEGINEDLITNNINNLYIGYSYDSRDKRVSFYYNIYTFLSGSSQNSYGYSPSMPYSINWNKISTEILTISVNVISVCKIIESDDSNTVWERLNKSIISTFTYTLTYSGDRNISYTIGSGIAGSSRDFTLKLKISDYNFLNSKSVNLDQTRIMSILNELRI